MFDEFYKAIGEVSGHWKIAKSEDLDLSYNERIVSAHVQSSGEEPAIISFLLFDL
jgi:hypothetical protein